MGELYEHRKTYLPPDLGHFDSPSSRKVPIQPAATIEDSARELQPAGLDNKAFGYATLRPQRVPYQKIWRTTQAGPAIVAVKDVEPLPIVLMKTEKRTANLNLTNLRKASDPHILQLLDFFWDWDNVTLVYEYEHSAASLARLLNAGVRFSEVDIATICHGVLEGLLYIHSVLGIIHGSLKCENVLLTMTGQVKIANIGKAILEGESAKKYQTDIEEVGNIVKELRGPAPRFRGDESLVVKFINKTTTSTATVSGLLKDDFILSAASPWTLKRLIVQILPFGGKFDKYKETQPVKID
ncbi:hypothetical protein VTN49DRAFT_750 [Thermomyces lanuginosus]|uniref:uncharacterized protein n=1 Tax=Thermomyces lanuginosus TaxID=5541 RepID=UPI003742FA69